MQASASRLDLTSLFLWDVDKRGFPSLLELMFASFGEKSGPITEKTIGRNT